MARRNTYRQQYQQEIKKIKRRIRNIEKRGYEFDLPTELTLPTKVTKKQFEKFKERYSIKNIYKYATYETSFGDKISGELARKAERQSAAHLGIRRKKEREWEEYRKEYGEYPQSFFDYYHTTRYEWEERIEEAISRQFYDYTDLEEGNAEPPSDTDIIFQNFNQFIDRIDNWSAPPDMGLGVIGIKYNRLQEIKNYALALASTQEDKIRIAKNIEENAEQINEILDRLMYATYKREQEVSKAGEYGNGYTPEADFITLQRILNN